MAAAVSPKFQFRNRAIFIGCADEITEFSIADVRNFENQLAEKRPSAFLFRMQNVDIDSSTFMLLVHVIGRGHGSWFPTDTIVAMEFVNCQIRQSGIDLIGQYLEKFSALKMFFMSGNKHFDGSAFQTVLEAVEKTGTKLEILFCTGCAINGIHFSTEEWKRCNFPRSLKILSLLGNDNLSQLDIERIGQKFLSDQHFVGPVTVVHETCKLFSDDSRSTFSGKVVFHPEHDYGLTSKKRTLESDEPASSPLKKTLRDGGGVFRVGGMRISLQGVPGDRVRKLDGKDEPDDIAKLVDTINGYSFLSAAHFFVGGPGDIDWKTFHQAARLISQTRELKYISLVDFSKQDEDGPVWDMTSFSLLVESSPNLEILDVDLSRTVYMDLFVLRAVETYGSIKKLIMSVRDITAGHVASLIDGAGHMPELRLLRLSGLKVWTSELFDRLCAAFPTMHKLTTVEIAKSDMEAVSVVDSLSKVFGEHEPSSLRDIEFENVTGVDEASIQSINDLLKAQKKNCEVSLSNDK